MHPLPKAVTAYLAAVKANDADLLASCFAADAVVHDEGRDHRGLAAIRAWLRETQEKYRFTMEPLEVSASGATVKLTARVTGTFPGSPIDLDYLFTIEDGKITSLEI